MSAYTVTSDGGIYNPDDLPKYSTPTEGERKTAAAFLGIMRNEPLGQWSDNRWKQAQHLDGVIYVAIRAICNLASGASYQLFRKNKRSRFKSTFGPGVSYAKSVPSPMAQGRDEDYIPFDDEDHPLAHLIAHPNQSETFSELSAKLVMQNRLTGVGPLWTIPNKDHKPVELWSLKTPTLYPLRMLSKQYPKGAWRVTPYNTYGWAMMPSGLGNSGAIIPGEEVKRWMERHPYLDWDGYSPLTAGAKQLDVLTSIDEARKTAMDDGLVLDTYLVIPGASQQELNERVQEMKNIGLGSKKHRAFRAFGTPSPESKATVQTVNARVVDMDFPEGWEQMTKFCLALFGVPASVAGLTGAGSYSEHYAARQQFQDEQTDYLESLATFYTKALAWPWCSYPGEFLIRVKPRPINDHELAEKKLGRQCQYDTILYNEVRAKDDLPPVPGGDVPVSVYVQQQQPQQPAMPGAEPGGEPSITGAEHIDHAVDTLTQPTAGAVPKPDNPQGKGSRPPLPGGAKSLLGSANTLTGSAGGFLIPPEVAPIKRRKRLNIRARVRKALQGIEE